MPLEGELRKLRWSLQKRGLVGSLRAIPEALRRSRRGITPSPPHPFDQRYGTETGGVIGGGALATGHRHDVHITAYAGVAPSRLRAALDRWQTTLDGERLDEFSFVDLGCGKGRALLLASERPFEQVLGVELNAGLAAVAAENATRWTAQGLARSQIEVRQGDATEFAYPDGPCLIFLYNPFGVPVIRSVLEQLHGRAARGQRVDLLFQNEGSEMPMSGDARLQLLWRGALPLEDEEAAAELVGSPEDVTSLYRFTG